MEMSQEELDGGVLKVALSGSFDIAGAGDVDLPLNIIGGSRDKLVVDFTDVDFLASIGVRVLVKVAKAMSARNGKIAIINPNDAAAKVLNSTGVDSVIPVVADVSAAVEAVS